jgi:hypothetical protein
MQLSFLYRDRAELRSYLDSARKHATLRSPSTVEQPSEAERAAQVLDVLRESGAISQG